MYFKSLLYAAFLKTSTSTFTTSRISLDFCSVFETEIVPWQSENSLLHTEPASVCYPCLPPSLSMSQHRFYLLIHFAIVDNTSIFRDEKVEREWLAGCLMVMHRYVPLCVFTLLEQPFSHIHSGSQTRSPIAEFEDFLLQFSLGACMKKENNHHRHLATTTSPYKLSKRTMAKWKQCKDLFTK